MDNEDYLDVRGAAEELGVSKKAIYGLLKKEAIPARRIGREWRFSRKSLANWMAATDMPNGNPRDC